MNGQVRAWFRQLRCAQWRRDAEFFERMRRIDLPLTVGDIQMTVHAGYDGQGETVGPYRMQPGTPTQLAALGLIVANRIHAHQRQHEYQRLVRDVQTPRAPLNAAKLKALADLDIQPPFSWETEPRVQIAQIDAPWVELTPAEAMDTLTAGMRFQRLVGGTYRE